MTVTADDARSLELLRATHIKSKGDVQARAGNWGRALERYADALAVCQGIDQGGRSGGVEVVRLMCTLRLNMSLACGKCLKWGLAVEHAEGALGCLARLARTDGRVRAVGDTKQVQKAYWRRGEGLMGLKRPEEAVYDFVRVYGMEGDGGEKGAYKGKVEAVVRVLRGMPERLGLLMRRLVDGVIDGDGMVQVVEEVEEVDDSTMQEAAYMVVKEMEADGAVDALESAYETCCRWLLHMRVDMGVGVDVGVAGDVGGSGEGLGVEEALVWRSRVCCKAKAYAQAREDAVGALRLLESRGDGREASTLVYRRLVMSGYVALGKALHAEAGYSGRSGPRALKALRKAVLCVECGGGGVGGVMGNVERLYDLVQEVTEGLTKEEVDAVERELGVEGTVLDRVGGEERMEVVGRDAVAETGTGTSEGGGQDKGVNGVLQVRLAFGTAESLTPFCREQLRKLVAWGGRVEIKKVGIEGVRTGGGELAVWLRVETRVGAEMVRERVLGVLTEASGQVGQGIQALEVRQLKGTLGEVVRVEVDEVESEAGDGKRRPQAPSHAITKATKPELQLALPYKEYKLVDSVGRPIERGQRHAFCMSRVYYDRSEMESTETWVELADGSCRWRQSGSEIKVIALKVPSDVAPRHVQVKFEPYEVRVTNKLNGETYLSGTLYRGIIPDDCFWTQLGGEGEDGFLITMTKMNLEVLQKHWMHSEMWWSKLFVDHPECQWDDYSKDYSDLPEEVMERHRIREAQKEETRALESKDEKRRKRLTGEEERRKRKRMDRLSALREGMCH